jgi:hypothetical protein
VDGRTLVWVGEGVFELNGPVVTVGMAVGDGGGSNSIWVLWTPRVDLASIMKLAIDEGSGTIGEADAGVAWGVTISNEGSATTSEVLDWQLLIK